MDARSYCGELQQLLPVSQWPGKSSKKRGVCYCMRLIITTKVMMKTVHIQCTCSRNVHFPFRCFANAAHCWWCVWRSQSNGQNQALPAAVGLNSRCCNVCFGKEMYWSPSWPRWFLPKENQFGCHVKTTPAPQNKTPNAFSTTQLLFFTRHEAGKHST